MMIEANKDNDKKLFNSLNNDHNKKNDDETSFNESTKEQQTLQYFTE